GDVFLGHSLGEFAAAAAAGMMSPEDCVRLVAARGLAMMALPLADRGAMLSAATDVETAREAARAASAHGTVVVANVNHPGQTVLSGETLALRAAAQWLEGRSIAVTWLDVSHAFHSPLVAGIADTMRGIASALPLRQPPGAVLSAAKALPYPADPEEVRQIFGKLGLASGTMLGAAIAGHAKALACSCRWERAAWWPRSRRPPYLLGSGRSASRSRVARRTGLPPSPRRSVHSGRRAFPSSRSRSSKGARPVSPPCPPRPSRLNPTGPSSGRSDRRSRSGPPPQENPCPRRTRTASSPSSGSRSKSSTRTRASWNNRRQRSRDAASRSPSQKR
ncbi:MAG: acyltransferase domain-containing protein, partial [Deltaproteobacteria bacterium]